MAKSLYTTLSKKNPYYISKHRYLELKHFCLQYPEWKERYSKLQLTMNKSGICIIPGTQLYSSDPVGNVASEMAELYKKMQLIEDCAKSTDEALGKYILVAVTLAKPYEYLQTVLEIPCCRDTFYTYYRKFFWLLNRR